MFQRDIFLLYQGRNSSVIHHSYLWSSKPFCIPELTCALFLSAENITSLHLNMLLILWWVCFDISDSEVSDSILRNDNNGFQMQMQHLKSTVDLYSL